MIRVKILAPFPRYRTDTERRTRKKNQNIYFFNIFECLSTFIGASNAFFAVFFHLFKISHFFASLYSNFPEATNSLRLSKLVVPSVKFRGENALLECLYELNNQKNRSANYRYEDGKYYRRNNYFYDNEEEQEETIYSVKWYKDDQEFYRYVPGKNPQKNSYKFDGIKVDVSIEKKICGNIKLY